MTKSELICQLGYVVVAVGLLITLILDLSDLGFDFGLWGLNLLSHVLPKERGKQRRTLSELFRECGRLLAG